MIRRRQNGGNLVMESDVIACLRAYERITKICDHMKPPALGSGAIVPMPGTSESELWMMTLGKHGGLHGLQILNEWMQHFFVSGPQIRKALRRLQVIRGHLTYCKTTV